MKNRDTNHFDQVMSTVTRRCVVLDAVQRELVGIHRGAGHKQQTTQ